MAHNDDNDMQPDTGATPPDETFQDGSPTLPLSPHPPAAMRASEPPAAPTGRADDLPQPEGNTTSPRAPFFRRTWVRITAAVAVAVILLGGGVGIGWAASHASNGSAAEHSLTHRGSESGSRGDDGDGRGHERDQYDTEGDQDDADATPSPTSTP